MIERKKIDGYIKKLNGITKKAIECNNIDRACMLIRMSAEIQYNWNQRYTDDELEKYIEGMANRRKSVFNDYMSKKNVIYFYDGFGLDTRGLALIYVKALCDLGYSLVYVVPEKAKGKQPEIQKVTAGKNIEFLYLKSGSFGETRIDEMLRLVIKYKPQYAFFYTGPDDVEACVAFGAMNGNVQRYQINLTDHAFWLGKNAFDCCIENREYGACVSYEYRHIPAEKIKLLQFYPYIDKTIPFAGFPFDLKKRSVLFSGGSLYKTIDDKGTYYNLVEKIMQRHKDLIFVYAGNGNRYRLKRLKTKFSDRVYILDERKDLYALMQHCTLYLNTYPLGGALMVQYAASAGLLPLSLLHYIECSFDGYLINTKDKRLEFFNEDELLNEVDRLLCDAEYRSKLESKIKDAVITEEMFKRELNNLLINRENIFDFNLHHIDTSRFRNHYMQNFTYESISGTIISKKAIFLWWRFPRLFFYRKVARMFIKMFKKEV